MKLVIRRFEPGDTAGIERLTHRLRAAGVHAPVYPEDSARPSEREPDVVRERLYVAAEGDEIRGAVWLREHAFWIRGERIVAGWAKYPVAESLIDRSYSGVPAALVFRLLREQPRLLALGMGGHGGPFARLLAEMGWAGSTVPFQFFPARPSRVLREVRNGGRRAGGRLLRRLSAYSGLGWAGYRLYRALRSITGPGAPVNYAGETVSRFGTWADEIWRENRACYGLVGRRDGSMLNYLYPENFEHLARLRVTHEGEDVGWVCLLHVDLRETEGDEHFGRLSVGLLADAFAAPCHARGVLSVGLRYLLDHDVDLVFSNQAHPAWISALRSLSFLRGPSNFAFYRSPAVGNVTADEATRADGLFINRGDCDGPRWW